MVLFPDKRLSYIFHIFLCIMLLFLLSLRREDQFGVGFFYFSYPENHEDMTRRCHGK